MPALADELGRLISPFHGLYSGGRQKILSPNRPRFSAIERAYRQDDGAASMQGAECGQINESGRFFEKKLCKKLLLGMLKNRPPGHVISSAHRKLTV
jgi:hypothetical protein